MPHSFLYSSNTSTWKYYTVLLTILMDYLSIALFFQARMQGRNQKFRRAGIRRTYQGTVGAILIILREAELPTCREREQNTVACRTHTKKDGGRDLPTPPLVAPLWL